MVHLSRFSIGIFNREIKLLEQWKKNLYPSNGMQGAVDTMGDYGLNVLEVKKVTKRSL